MKKIKHIKQNKNIKENKLIKITKDHNTQNNKTKTKTSKKNFLILEILDRAIQRVFELHAYERK